jgi:hypothetical protein
MLSGSEEADRANARLKAFRKKDCMPPTIVASEYVHPGHMASGIILLASPLQGRLRATELDSRRTALRQPRVSTASVGRFIAFRIGLWPNANKEKRQKKSPPLAMIHRLSTGCSFKKPDSYDLASLATDLVFLPSCQGLSSAR